MAQLHFTDEILMAFADGELDEQAAARVEQAMAADPAVARTIAEFLRSRRLIRSAFPEETASDVPPELRAAVDAMIHRFEEQGRPQSPPVLASPARAPLAGRWRLGMALAASVAAIAIATAGYLVGRQGLPSASADPIAHLATAEVDRVLSESPSGQERDLPFGRMRVISTFRMANGHLCREFKLQTQSVASEAVACREGDRDWAITFALASRSPETAYVPSGAADLMSSYLQNSGAGEPLLDAAETQALSEVRRQR